MNHAELRERIARALWAATEGGHVDWDETNDWWRDKKCREADAVLPVVQQHAVAVLREAADALAELPAAPTNNRGSWAAKYLRARADAEPYEP